MTDEAWMTRIHIQHLEARGGVEPPWMDLQSTA